jgi:DNA-binding CsgD family transcriptional regulator
MRGAIGWSYELLTPEEQQLLRRLSIFVGGWTLEAATEVCAPDSDAPDEVLQGITSLVDKNLVVVKPAADGDVRFAFLETIYEFTFDRLVQSGELPDLRRKHAECYLRFVEHAERELDSPGQVMWLERLEQDYGNVRSALDWYQDAQSEAAVELGLRIGGALQYFWEIRGHVREGREKLRQLLEHSQARSSSHARARALEAAAWLGFWLGDVAQVETLLGESRAIWNELGNPVGIARSTAILSATLATHTTCFERAASLAHECLALARPLEDTWSVGMALWALGLEATAGRHDFVECERYFQQLLDVSSRSGNTWGMACALYRLSHPARRAGNLERAAALQRQSLSLYWQLRNTRGIAQCVEVLASLARGLGKLERATRLLSLAEVLANAANYRRPPALAVAQQAAIQEIRAKLGEEAFDAAWTEAAAFTMERAIAYALAEDDADSVAGGVSGRELDIVRLVACGLTDREIAFRLGISPRTVHAHLRSVFAKANVPSRTSLAVWAVRHHLTDDGASVVLPSPVRQDR